VFVPVSSSIADSYSWVRGVGIPALFAASKCEIPSFLFPTSGFRALAIVVLSATTILHRAFLRRGVDAQLIVFEALPHAFWHNPDLPESKEANKFIAEFFTKHLGG
jgi:hypothetical protein